MFTQIITPTEESVKLDVPREMIGHAVKVTLDDLEENGKRRFTSLEDVHAHFRAIRLDLRGFKFNRDEANER